MKKLLFLAAAAVLSLPAFAITLDTGDTVTAGSSTIYVTKIAPSASSNSVYDFVIQDGNVTYNYAISAGDTIKIKNIEYKVASVSRNTVTIDQKSTPATTKKNSGSTTTTSKYIDAK
ncbi:MAG: hypothetical protein IKO57_07490 [Treponema sp.]|nr:hypothetical protein [Treponema sp.]MBR4630270.1 hypothetical protein [Treponema sp.]MBR6912405.1 hypothetical protein [Treponema sp.]MCR5126027.1 hypothetical protein [Treponema sp.]